tara:strand:+ start:843 stop:1163 length:321 start_codon:yes stop_codon:yes gene_type:complete
MKKLILILAVLWLGLNAFAKSVQADEYNKAVVANVITNHKIIDQSEVLKSEMQKLAYVMMLQMADTLEKTMPYIIDEITASLRQESDKLYKCMLLDGTKITDKECQ